MGPESDAPVRAVGKEMVFVGFRGALIGCVCVLLLGILAGCGGGAGNPSGGSKKSNGAAGPAAKTVGVK